MLESVFLGFELLFFGSSHIPYTSSRYGGFLACVGGDVFFSHGESCGCMMFFFPDATAKTTTPQVFRIRGVRWMYPYQRTPSLEIP